MKLIISNRSDRPIYEQIKQQIKEAIFAGELEAGDLLPSIRQLARDLQVSVITTTRAYNDLEQEGFVNNVQGKGCYVLPRNQELLREHARQQVEQGLAVAVEAAKAGHIAKTDLLELLDILCREEHYE